MKAAVTAAGRKNMAALAKDGKYFAVRNKMRSGKVTPDDLKATYDGKTVVEWIWDDITKWKGAVDMGEPSLLAFKLMSELKYRCVSATFNPISISMTFGSLFPRLQLLCGLQNADVSSPRMPGGGWEWHGVMEYTSDFFKRIISKSNKVLASTSSTVDIGQQSSQRGMSMLLQPFSRPSPGFSPH